MKKLVWFVIAAGLTVACGDKPMVIYNGCNGSWVRVADGRGNLLAERIPYGQEWEVTLEGQPGAQVELLASGFDLVTNRPLGSATATRTVYRSYGPFSSQTEPWQIMYLQTTDPSGGCRR